MKFKFSLDPVLKVRKHQEKIQKQKLAEELAEKQKISNLREEVQGRLENYLHKADSNNAAKIHMIRRHSSHVEQIHQHMEKLSKKLSEADKKVHTEREKLADAHKKLHIMEKVKESEKTEFTSRMAKDEQKFLDEVATQSYSR